MADLISMLSAASGATAEADPNFKQTVLLLHGDGTNGAQNNTFLDGSTNNFTITRNGNTTQGTFSPFSVGAGQWSNYFDGTGDYLSIPYNSALVFDSGDFTIDCWFYLSGNAAQNGSGDRAAQLASCIGAGPSAGWDLIIAGNSTTTGTALNFANRINNTTVYVITGSATVTQNQWNHVAVVRSGTTTTIYLNGTSIGSGTLTNQSITSAQPLWIGRQNVTNFTHDFPGYISNFRIVKGTAVYTSAFTPSTTPLTAITNTSLLTCQSNRFVDNSTNAFAITRNGDVRVTPFSPFAPTAAYSAGTNGGSGYFDGTGDYLNFTEFSSATDFTCECWFYRGPNVSARHTLFGGNRTISNARNCQLAVSNDGGIVVILNDAVVANFDNVGGNAVPRDSWNHIAYVRSSTTISVFVNGTRIATGTSSATLYVTQVGAYIDSLGASVCNGYISSARVTNTAVYDPSQTTLTVPTAPLTAISGTSLLLNFTNAGIIDNTGKNNLETVGNAQIDTTTKKFGTGSLEFDGDDYLTSYQVPLFNFGSENFTLECWLYPTAYGGFFGKNQTSDYRWMKVDVANTGVITFYVTTTGSSWAVNQGSSSASGVWVLNTWWHFALVRNGTSFKIYKDGTEVISATVSGSIYNIDADPFILGSTSLPGFAFRQSFTGYIDDLRITKGVARYTANFTAPTKAFPDQ